jgi:coenzyme F420-0:L-glutamate ligase/coenzyme F420-1:gamma-L-glutamate ligase
MPAAVSLIPLLGVPLVAPGDDLAAVTAAALRANGLSLEDNDVLVVAQKIVSKAEGRIVDLAQVNPSARAVALAAETGKDPRLVEVVLSESRRVVRRRPGLIIVEHRLGFVMANAGVDHSNVPPPPAIEDRGGTPMMPDGGERVLLLPRDPDGSARALRLALIAEFGKRIAVVVNDSFGRPWRRGVAGVALGAAGLPALIDCRGHPDLFGRKLLVTEIGFADEIAAAASLVMGQADEGLPIVLVRGLAWSAPELPAAALVRPAEHDLFR